MAAPKKPWADLVEDSGKPGSKQAATGEAATPEAPPTTVYMHTLIGNPDNPRAEADYADDDPEFRELKESMRSVGQLQPAVAMSREAFLRTKPEHRSRIGCAEWIVILGNRRFHAAKQLSWTKFEIRVRDRLASGEDDKVDEAVVIENIHRKRIAPYKEAEFLQRMVERHGSQEKVAERIGKSQMYVSNRLSLLNLPPELGEAVDTKQLKVKTAERIAKIEDPEEQKAAAAEEILKAQQPRAPRKRAATAPVQNPVLKPAPDTDTVGRPATVITTQENHGLGRVPEPRPTPAPAASPDGALPWHDGTAVMDTAFERLAPEQRSAFMLRYFQRSIDVEAVITDMRGKLPTHDRSSLAAIFQQVAAGLLRDA
ncbi:ParB/RepB/Spo0J family partition protein [Streptomyces erythrochromogenes]|uniref:ParB/RepB/Spo0J family partition protein n=1 Tax=Streptomyces erythrochromogenes TaxID=285574 RepID=UPI003435E75A